jgi:hypothetical protein
MGNTMTCYGVPTSVPGAFSLSFKISISALTSKRGERGLPMRLSPGNVFHHLEDAMSRYKKIGHLAFCQARFPPCWDGLSYVRIVFLSCHLTVFRDIQGNVSSPDYSHN